MSRIHEALKRAEEHLKAGASGPVNLTRDEALEESPLEARQSFIPMAQGSAPNVVSTLTANSGALPKWVDGLPPAVWKPNASKLIFSDQTRSNEPGMEEFRTLRSRLYRLREKMPLKTIMVSSALPGEGKTFVSSNLAYVLARQNGRRVLLIDGDLRKPSLHVTLGADAEPGLSDYLTGDAKTDDIVQRGPDNNLFFISGGRIVSNPAELIGNGHLKKLLDELEAYFDWIVFDSAPLVPVTDSSLVARHANGVLLVVKTETTRVDLAQRATQELKNLPLLGVVLNRAEGRAGYSSYYYSYGRTADVVKS